ncbi:DUF3841 domain-containing protein [Psychroserpens sp. MEBiC05023]
MKVKLWTIQDEKGWKELKTKGILIAKEKFIYQEFKFGYEWMKTQMEKRLSVDSQNSSFPIWAWYQHYDSRKPKPDLRKSGHLPPGTKGYRIEILKERKDILLSDFVLWHFPLCYRSYIANSESEAIECENIPEYDELINSKNKNDQLINKIEKSWEKIFDMNFDLDYYTFPMDEKKIQATFWELNIEDIVNVTEFIAR